jgi:hypothetical protein
MRRDIMSTSATVVVILLVVLAIALAAWFIIRQRRSERLRSRFGPEYNRVVEERGDKQLAEAVLEKREKRLERLQIRPLPSSHRDRFAQAWQVVQSRFVDAPREAVAEADRLVTDVMKARGYPAWESDFEQRAEDISVDHPQLVADYRAAAEIARQNKLGKATTEDLRRAMVYYRTLFDDLLGLQEVRR